jgi:hypothetical protein
MIGGVILARGLTISAPGIAEGLSQVFEKLLVRLRSGSCRLEEQSNRRPTESAYEASSGNPEPEEPAQEAGVSSSSVCAHRREDSRGLTSEKTPRSRVRFAARGSRHVLRIEPNIF